MGYASAWAIVEVFQRSVLLGALASYVVVFMLSRILLVLPATAVGRPISLLDSWRLTRRRKLLVILIAVVYPTVIRFPVSWIPDSSTIGYLMRSAIGMLTLIVTVILLSFAYQQIEKERASAK